MVPSDPRRQEKMSAVSFDLQPMSTSQMGVAGGTWGKLENNRVIRKMPLCMQQV